MNDYTTRLAQLRANDPTPEQLAEMHAKIEAAKSAKKIDIPAKYILNKWVENNFE